MKTKLLLLLAVLSLAIADVSQADGMRQGVVAGTGMAVVDGAARDWDGGRRWRGGGDWDGGRRWRGDWDGGRRWRGDWDDGRRWRGPRDTGVEADIGVEGRIRLAEVTGGCVIGVADGGQDWVRVGVPGVSFVVPLPARLWGRLCSAAGSGYATYSRPDTRPVRRHA